MLRKHIYSENKKKKRLKEWKIVKMSSKVYGLCVVLNIYRFKTKGALQKNLIDMSVRNIICQYYIIGMSNRYDVNTYILLQEVFSTRIK